jgi:hypothetical protein
VVIPLGSSSINQYRDLGMREYLERLAAEDDRGDAVVAMRGHDDKVTAFRHGGIDDRLVRILMLDVDQLVFDPCYLRCVIDGEESFLGMFGRESMKRRQDRQAGNFGADLLG